jgi:hypothetical protein
MKNGGDYSIKDFEEYLLPGQTATSLYRKSTYIELGKKLTELNIPKGQMIDRLLVLCMLSLGKMFVMNEEMAAYRRVMNIESGSWSSKNDYYSTDNVIKYLEGMSVLERVAKVLNMDLCFDARRSHELRKLYDNKNSFSQKDFTKIRREIKKGYNSKIPYWKIRIKKELLKR